MGLGLYSFEGFDDDDFPVPGEENASDYVPYDTVGDSEILKPQWDTASSEFGGYNNIKASFLKNLRSILPSKPN